MPGAPPRVRPPRRSSRLTSSSRGGAAEALQVPNLTNPAIKPHQPPAAAMPRGAPKRRNVAGEGCSRGFPVDSSKFWAAFPPISVSLRCQEFRGGRNRFWGSFKSDYFACWCSTRLLPPLKCLHPLWWRLRDEIFRDLFPHKPFRGQEPGRGQLGTPTAPRHAGRGLPNPPPLPAEHLPSEAATSSGSTWKRNLTSALLPCGEIAFASR